MTALDQTAIDRARAEADYAMALAALSRLKTARTASRAAHRSAIEAEIAEGNATNVDLAARFAVTEGTIRNIRQALGPTP
jgi:hypothetical protein